MSGWHHSYFARQGRAPVRLGTSFQHLTLVWNYTVPAIKASKRAREIYQAPECIYKTDTARANRMAYVVCVHIARVQV